MNRDWEGFIDVDDFDQDADQPSRTEKRRKYKEVKMILMLTNLARNIYDFPENSETGSSSPYFASSSRPTKKPKKVNKHKVKPTSNNVPQTVIQGIPIISTGRLSERFRSIFPFPNFNAVQSKCFQTVYESDQNFVLSSPTGSGKTAILELAICRLLQSRPTTDFKVIYQGPTKALCTERQRDWQAKFSSLGLKVYEFTGDSDNNEMVEVRDASIIVTTPEKWDSMTRKWKDNQKLMQLVKLFFIDEVHMLRDERGAVLEAVVSRMKSMGSDVRFIALSATVPNAEDVAVWLCDKTGVHATLECFGDEFRPVKIEKHVVGVKSMGNDFALDKCLDRK
jgi:ATP-dependent DNA helicase HFM1/MER3